jgi:pentatricopeptide repeat protein
MKNTPDVQANCISYSALISACGSSGRWEEALRVFEDMVEAAQSNPDCTPNTITYSALISACERGGRLDKALEVSYLEGFYQLCNLPFCARREIVTSASFVACFDCNSLTFHWLVLIVYF